MRPSTNLLKKETKEERRQLYSGNVSPGRGWWSIIYHDRRRRKDIHNIMSGDCNVHIHTYTHED